MENRLLGGRVQICCYCGQDRNNNGKRAAVAYCSYNTTPSPTPLPYHIRGGDAKRAESHAVCCRDKKIIINKGKKYGLRIEIRLEAK